MDEREWRRRRLARANLLRDGAGPLPVPDEPQPAASGGDGLTVIGVRGPGVPAAPPELVAALVPVVLPAAPDVAALVPPAPAAALGRVGAPVLPGGAAQPPIAPERLADRLLGALELGLPLLPVEPPPLLVQRLRVDVGEAAFAVLEVHGESEPARALRLVDQFAPGARDLAAGLLAGLVEGPAGALLDAPATARSEEDLAVARGRGHLAVAVVTALAVLRATGHPVLDDGPPAVVGLALDAAVRVLGRPGHGEALQEVAPAPFPVPAAGGPLRGEPGAPPRATRYGWVERTVAGDACTVTLVRGATPAEVLTAFGADPGDPEPLAELREQFGIDPWVAVLPVEDGVLAVEPNGWQGTVEPVLRLLAARGRAASAYLGGHGVRRWSFARDGGIVAAFEPLGPPEVEDPEVRAALDGLDLDDHHDMTGKGLEAVARYAGFAITPGDVARIEAADVAYRILPRLPELYREERLPDGTRRWGGHGPLGADTDRLVLRSDDELRDLAWWAAGAAAEHAGRARDPSVSATLRDRALGPDAEHAARASGLEGGADHQMWLALHHATNPDVLAAAIHTIDRARWVFGPDAADFLDRVRRRLNLPRLDGS